jgi:hypothetical protein
MSVPAARTVSEKTVAVKETRAAASGVGNIEAA